LFPWPTQKLLARCLLCVACASITSAHAQYPERAVRLVVGYAPGGGIDTLARIVARHLSDKWNKGMVVENRPGADSNLAAEAVAKSAPDGYTLFVSFQLMFASVTSAVPLLDARKLRALAISTLLRSPLLPQVPPVAETLKIPFDEPGTWIGLLAPAATADAVIAKIRKDAGDTLQSSAVQSTLAERGFVTIDQGPEPFAAFIKSEVTKSARLMKTPDR
jgi:tripartite-type tricarboxylate transporter receptor subunit TctC